MLEGQYLRLRTWTHPELLVILVASAAAACFGLLQFQAMQELTVGAVVLGILLLALLLERAQMANFDLTVFYATSLIGAIAAYTLRVFHIRFSGFTWQAPSVFGGLLCATALTSFANLEWRTRPLLAARTDGYVTMNVPDFIKALETLGALKEVPRFDAQRIRVDFWRRLHDRGVISVAFAPKPEEVQLRRRGTTSRQLLKPLG